MQFITVFTRVMHCLLRNLVTLLAVYSLVTIFKPDVLTLYVFFLFDNNLVPWKCMVVYYIRTTQQVFVSFTGNIDFEHFTVIVLR